MGRERMLGAEVGSGLASEIIHRGKGGAYITAYAGPASLGEERMCLQVCVYHVGFTLAEFMEWIDEIKMAVEKERDRRKERGFVE